jgi:hypothetical protein
MDAPLFSSISGDLVVELKKCHSGKFSEATMKVFLSSTYVDLIEHRKAAHDKNHPRMKPRMHEYQTPIREFVKNLS